MNKTNIVTLVSSKMKLDGVEFEMSFHTEAFNLSVKINV